MFEQQALQPELSLRRSDDVW